MKRLQGRGVEISKRRNRQEVRRIARRTARILVVVIFALVLAVIALVFKLGYMLWPAWLVSNRLMCIGLLGLVILALSLFAPVIIEADSNPQPFSGPGDRPMG